MNTTFPTPADGYDRDNESEFRRLVRQELAALRTSVAGSGDSTYFNVRDYAPSNTTEWDDAFAAVDTDAQAAGGVILVPPGTYDIADDLTITAAIMFAGGIIKAASGKTLTVGGAADITALAGEWFDDSDGGIAVRPGVAHKEDGLDLDGDLTANGNIVLKSGQRFHPSKDDPDTYFKRASADLWEFYSNGQLMFTFNDSQMGFFGAAPASRQTYSVSNVTPDRTYDAASTTTAELGDVVGTVIADLQAQGILG